MYCNTLYNHGDSFLYHKMTDKYRQVAKQMGVGTTTCDIMRVLLTDYDQFIRQKSIFYVNIIRDHLIRIYRVQDSVDRYDSCVRQYRTDYQYDKRLANTIVSSLAFRFDDQLDDDDYSKWSDEELFMVMKKSLKLPNLLLRHDRLREQLLSIIPYDINTVDLVNPLAAKYIFDEKYQTIPKEKWDDWFNELYWNVFKTDDGLYMLKMGNWDNKSLLITLVLLGVDYDITTSNFDYNTIMRNTPLLVLTERKNPFKRIRKPPMLRFIASNNLKYYDFKTKTPLSLFKTHYFLQF